MASKQLGKLRQLMGEVIMTRDKTIQSDEFRELEHDVELRRQGLWRLDVASDEYRHYLLKKKVSEVTGTDDKVLALDALGVVMIKHGEEFGDESAYGQSLVSLGRAHCNVATLQESYAMTLEETYLTAVRQSEDEIKEYQTQRKKLESRRISYDAAAARLEKLKHAKKVPEKDREEAEEELETAKARYEETLEDVRTRMYSIQENEVIQLRELTNFLDLEINFVHSYLDELQKVRSAWVDEDTLKKLGASKARPSPRPTPASRSGSIRSAKSIKKQAEEEAAQSSADEQRPTMSRKKSLSRKKSDVAESKPPSRAPSRASRKRSDSTATAASEKEDKEKEKPKPEKSSHRLSVAGWSVSSMIGRGGKKDKEKEKNNKEKFAELDSDLSETDEFGVTKPPHKRRSSVPGLPSTSPKLPARLLKSFSNGGEKEKDSGKDKENYKRVVALHDFAAGSTDELSFKAGDQIEVISEVLDGWWMGELEGRRGLFPTTYTEIINSSQTSLPPPLPHRPSASVTRALGLSNGAKKSTSSYSSLEDGHPFGDHQARNGKSSKVYEDSIQSSNFSDDDESSSLMHVQRIDDALSSKYVTGLPAPTSPAVPVPTSLPPPVPVRRDTTSGSPAKKAPPPPPPRRSTLSVNAPTPPPVPSRPGTLRTKSSTSSSYSSLALTGTAAADPDGLTYSPFDSPRDESTRFDCREFKQNPFKPQGFCSNCFKMH
ncbi:BAR-domain-containing protein [Dichomitus squalens LYAD-421 SS1]|uniref:BAR-domain-containing protein n=1 Tax=Dichomitus squalens (strain LYAD-421) TaxID=732165 RepID=R7SZ67_DICSQ|nr:BAR-domain-containing protein [Dichomitus squalens LYAD-421 SS1]EJF60252.1 BAR-domain-containing protein [Dichomitus squalens LYAD-421 SS1]